MNNKNVLKNIGISMAMRPISIALSFVYTPMALSFLGDARYGVWAIILNIVSWISLFDIGIGNGMRNRLAEAYASNNQRDAQSYVSTAYIATAIMSLVFFIIINAVWNLFDLGSFFNLNVEGENTNLVIAISVFFVCINFILSLSKTAAYAIQKSGVVSITNVIAQILQIIVLFLISQALRQSLVAVALMYGCVTLVENLLLYGYITKGRPYLKPKFSKIKVRYMKSMMTLGIGFFVMQICSLILNTTDNLLISNLYGSSEVTPYSIVYKVFYMFVSIHGIIIMPMWSAFTEAATLKDIDWIRSTIKKVNGVTVLLSVGVIVAVFLFRPFAVIWLGKNYNYQTSLIVTVAVYMIAQMFANNYASFLCGIGNIRVSTMLAAVQALLNIPLSVYFANYCHMGLTGIILGSLCVMAISAILLPVISYRWLNAHSNIGE